MSFVKSYSVCMHISNGLLQSFFFQQIDITLKKNKKAKNSEILSPECFVKTACWEERFS